MVTYETKTCPSCGANWLGMEIPEEHLGAYGGQTHFSRLIGIIDLHSDRTYKYQCPDCKEEFPHA